ncbi:MAG: DUF1631 domain-containing protein [Thiobacillus sp.]|nr:DUF1631 domain-containing protein [Thiobacillus sp.]
MPDNSSVVVNLNQFERHRRTQASAESLSQLHACRDQLIEGVTRALTRHAEAMENTLLAMADRSPLLDTRNTYFGAQGILNKRANELLAACKDAYCESFQSAAGLRDRPAGSAPAELSLSLVEDQDFELTLAVDKAASRLRYNCAEELVALDARIAHLLGRADLAENDNPLGPRALCESLLEGIGRMGVEQNIRIVLLNQFDLVLTTELAAIYQGINRHLAEHGVLPDIKVGLKRRASAQPSHAGPAHGGGTHSAGSAAPANDMLRLFEQLAGGMGAPGGGSLATSGHAGRSGEATLLDAISQLQMGGLALPDGGHFELPMIEATAVRNVLRVLQQSPVMQSASPLDAVLVDAVAMLFDVVFEETALPDRLKAQIARLQIPVLKAAMLDRTFFSQTHHPVRRMLDAVASLAVHLPDTEAGKARLEAISSVIGKVLDNFEQDIALFAEAAEELEAMHAQLDDQVEETAAVSLREDIDAIRRGERAELAPVVVHDFINRALSGETPDSVREFLRRDWAKLLTRFYIEEGDQGAHFNSHVETMRELVWSVQTKTDMDARLMLVRILPGLLKRLRDGAAEIELSQKIADRFFASLVILHANAVRPGAQPVPLPETAPEEIAVIEAERAQADAVEETRVAEAVAAVEPLTEPPVPEFEDEFMLRARALAKGDWIEFHYEDGTFRWARLGWVGGVRNTYLFSDQDGMNSFSISLARLADKLRRGEAVLVERKSITESAFGKLMSLFRQKLGHA